MQPFRPSPASYAALAQLLLRALPEFPTTVGWLVRQDEQRDPARPLRREVMAAPEDLSRLLGVVEWSLHPLVADPSRFFVSVAVDPAAGRRGLGTALLRRALDALPRDRAIRVEAEAAEARPWSARLLERHGFQCTLRSTPTELDLARFEPSGFEHVLRRVEAAGVVLRPLGHEGAADELLLQSLHAFQFLATVDVPGVDGPPQVPFEVWRASYRDNPDFLPEGHLVAFDGATMVGMTQLWGSLGDSGVLFTGFTGVARSHRRLGLATALKARSLRWAKGLRTPAGQHLVVRTANADSNPMLGINLRLGFVEQPSRLRFELRRPAG